MWIYDYKTKREYFASSPRSKFYCYQSIQIEPIPGKPCTILIKKGMEEGRKPARTFEQMDIFANQTIKSPKKRGMKMQFVLNKEKTGDIKGMIS